ncbi:MFS transporter [Campylobacter sp. MG1]|uniref:MFS transporter n=1 Tax=Campylobacter sp. MG1 TaxID=2976332 RepID=UPI00226D25AE|nr:MFS transporter [Campylobacter sp. MG1]
MNMLKISILSISLATVTGGAAVAPALGLIAKHFSNDSELLIKLIITLPSLFIIFSSLIFAKLANYLSVKQLAFIGFILFIVGGVAPFFLDDIIQVLVFRAILGLGTGFLMPLSVSLLGFLFKKEEQGKLMGLSAMCNQLGAVITVSFSGFLASISWQYSFLIYLFALVLFVLNMIFLPNIKIAEKKKKLDLRNIKNLSGIYINLFLVQVLFFNFTNNFSIIYQKEQIISASFIGVIMGLNGLFGAIASMKLANLIKKIKTKIKIIGTFIYILAFLLFSIRLNSVIEIFGINLMLILGILGAILNGIAMGLTLPFFFSQISTRSKKQNLATNMAVASIAVFSGQFSSPIIDGIFEYLFNLHHPRDTFLIATFIAIFLFIYNLRLKIKLKN